MKRQEAIELEQKVQNEVALILDEENIILVSLTLSNRLKFSIENGCEYLFDRKRLNLECIGNKDRSYIYFSDIEEIRNKIENYLKENEKEIRLLLWSYDNQRDLED